MIATSAILIDILKSFSGIYFLRDLNGEFILKRSLFEFTVARREKIKSSI